MKAVWHPKNNRVGLSPFSPFQLFTFSAQSKFKSRVFTVEIEFEERR
jgi:hypothetical protein